MSLPPSKHRCLPLGPTLIGSKSTDMGADTFDNITMSMKNTVQADHFLEQSKIEMEKRFGSVFDNTMQNLMTFPPQYDYGVEIKKDDKSNKGETARRAGRAMQFGDENAIKQRIQIIEQNLLVKKTAEDTREKQYLQQILEKKRPLSCENKVILRFRNFFEKQRGICLHGYKPEEYLKRYLELAKDLRKKPSNNPVGLLPLEEHILRVMNIPVSDVDNWVQASMNKIQTISSNLQSTTSNSFSWRSIHTALDLDGTWEKCREDQRKALKKFLSKFAMKWDPKQKKMVDKKDKQGRKVECQYSNDTVMTKLFK